MLSTILTIFSIIAVIVLLAGALGVGFLVGRSYEKATWIQRGKQIIAGQRVWIQNLGEVFVLGYNEDGSLVDYVPEDFLQGKWPYDFSNEELDAHTFSVPTEQFITQIPEIAVKQAARLNE